MRFLQVLSEQDFGNIVPPVMGYSLPERVRLRIKEEMTRRHLSQREVAELLKDDQPRISRMLSGEQTMRLEDLEALCFAVGIQPTEAVRDHGLEFCAEMTPTEVRALQNLRNIESDDERQAILTLLRVKAKGSHPERYAAPPKPRQFKGRS